MSGDGLQAATKRTVTVPMSTGETVTISTLTVQDFATAREQALQEFKRDRIKTWTNNLDLMPESDRSQWMRDAFERAESLTYDDLPKREMLVPQYGRDGKLQRRDGKPVMKLQRVEYALWWMSETFNGKLFMTWLAIKKTPGQEQFTLDDADALFMDALNDLESVAQTVGDISKVQLAGKSEASGPAKGPKKSKKRNKRRRKNSGR